MHGWVLQTQHYYICLFLNIGATDLETQPPAVERETVDIGAFSLLSSEAFSCMFRDNSRGLRTKFDSFLARYVIPRTALHCIHALYACICGVVVH